MSFSTTYANEPNMLNYIRNNVLYNEISSGGPTGPTGPQGNLGPTGPTGLSGQYAIFEQTSAQSVSGGTNTAILWDTTVSNTITGLTLNGKQIQNNSGQTMVLLVTFSVRWGGTPTLVNSWINKQLNSDDPNLPSTLQNNFYGQVLLSNLNSDVSLCSTGIIQLENGRSINTVIYTNISTTTSTEYNPQVSLSRIA